MKPDRDLLHEVASGGSADAFAQIVDRYLNLVYAAARRQVSAAAADDVTQAVFLLLWQRASRISDASTLPGWLVNATRLTALQANRAEQRRRRREKIAAANRPLTTGDVMSKTADDLAPLLDAALCQLRDHERTAVALRYLQDKSIPEIAAAIGISQPAAAKRVSRGLDRLRRYFRTRGADLPSAVIASTLADHGRLHLPHPSLTEQVLANTPIGGHAASRALVKSVVLALWIKSALNTTLAVLMAALLLSGLWVAANGRHPAVDQSAAAPAAASAMVAPRIKPINVGIIVSLRTATSLRTDRRLYGFDIQTRIAREFHAPDIAVYPVIEPGSDSNPQLSGQLDRDFPRRPPINGFDPAALEHLDVIIANEVWDAPPRLTVAVDTAVSSGVSFLNNGGFATQDPGLVADGPPARLTGLIGPSFYSSDDAVACDVIADHPLLAGIWPPGTHALRLMGVYGILPPDATPLVKVTDMSALPTHANASSENPRYGFFPIYLSHLGQGKIIGCQFGPWWPAPAPFQATDRSKFFTRCVRWLAGRAVE